MGTSNTKCWNVFKNDRERKKRIANLVNSQKMESVEGDVNHPSRSENTKTKCDWHVELKT